MTFLGKIYPYCIIGVVTSIIVRFTWSGKLLTALNVKLERLKVAILFTIADVFGQNNKNQRMQKLSHKNSFTLGWTIHPVKKYWFKL